MQYGITHGTELKRMVDIKGQSFYTATYWGDDVSDERRNGENITREEFDAINKELDKQLDKIAQAGIDGAKAGKELNARLHNFTDIEQNQFTALVEMILTHATDSDSLLSFSLGSWLVLQRLGLHSDFITFVKQLRS